MKKSDSSELLRELAENVSLITKAVAIQKKRIDAMGGDRGSRQVGIDKGAAPDVEISWPMDMNKPINAKTTPLQKSFFNA
jgi:hypothetical protein